MGTAVESDVSNIDMGQTNSQELFYGVHIPNFNDDHFLHVYTERAEALKVVKHHKKARFKAFKQRSDAVNFAVNGSETYSAPDDNGINPQTVSTVSDAEKPSAFKGPKSQDMVALRRIIESGNVKSVYDTVWENPRYLISSGDTPSILQEGSRYNALHVAAKTKNAAMADLILQTVGDPAFCRLLYGEESTDKYDTNVERAAMLLDLYLNTPDKGMHETPLHFAVKFGAVQVVAILVSYAQCDKSRRNKFGQMPVDIICARCSHINEEIKKEILHLLENEYYVPVLRADDNSIPPSVGLPFSPKKPPVLNEDPISPRLEIHAFAGPMKKTEAAKFHQHLKVPQRFCLSCIPSAVRLTDTEKGIERVGRDLAAHLNVPWKEYWTFLDTFIDLSSSEGLDTLENHLSRRFQEVENKSPRGTQDEAYVESPFANHLEGVLKVDQSLDSSDIEPEVLSPVTQLCSMMKACTIMDDSLGSGLGRSPNSSSSSSNGSIVSSSSARFFDWLNRKRPGFEKIVQSDSQNEAILAALSQPALSPFLYVEKSLQLFAKRITASLGHIMSGNVTNHLSDSIRDVLRPEVKRVQNLVSSYMEDVRFVAVDYHLVHSRVASSVAERLVSQLSPEERELFYNTLQEMLSARGHLDVSLSSEDEEPVPSTSTPYRQCRPRKQSGSSNQRAAIRCVISQIVWALDQLPGSGPDGRSPLPPRPLVRSESECLEMWSDAYPCSCQWPSQNQSNFSRGSRKSSSMKRSFNNSIKIDVKECAQRKLVFDNDEGGSSADSESDRHQGETIERSHSSDGEGNSFYTPPSSPILDVSGPVDGLSDSDSDDLVEPEEGPAVFLEGNQPTRLDLDVLNALSRCHITPTTYPYLYRWRHGVLLYSSAEREKWKTPTCRLRQAMSPSCINASVRNSSNAAMPDSDTDVSTTPVWSRVIGAFSPRLTRSCSSGHASYRLSNPVL